MKYDIKFDSENSNLIIIKENGRHLTSISCPPIENGCDIINFSEDITLKSSEYKFNYKGLIIITTKDDRKIYHKGNLIAETKRNLSKI